MFTADVCCCPGAAGPKTKFITTHKIMLELWWPNDSSGPASSQRWDHL